MFASLPAACDQLRQTAHYAAVLVSKSRENDEAQCIWSIGDVFSRRCKLIHGLREILCATLYGIFEFELLSLTWMAGRATILLNVATKDFPASALLSHLTYGLYSRQEGQTLRF
jgi:hypothetical protein